MIHGRIRQYDLMKKYGRCDENGDSAEFRCNCHNHCKIKKISIKTMMKSNTANACGGPAWIIMSETSD